MDKPEAESMETDDAENPLGESLEEPGAGESSEGAKERGGTNDEAKNSDEVEGVERGERSEEEADIGEKSEGDKDASVGDKDTSVGDKDTSDEVKENCDSNEVHADRDSASEESCQKDIDNVTVHEREPEKEQEMECGVDPLLENKEKDDGNECGEGDRENADSEENKGDSSVSFMECELEKDESTGDKGNLEDSKEVNSWLDVSDSQSTDLQKDSSENANGEEAGNSSKEDVGSSKGNESSEECQRSEVMEVEVGSGESTHTEEKKDEDAEEDIIELEVYKKPAEIVDLANDDEVEMEKQEEEKVCEKDAISDEQCLDSNNKGIKLRSLASLVEKETQEVRSDDNSTESTISVATPLADGPAIGEILEHGEIIGPAEMGGLQLRISNVVGGEDSITGLSTDEDRDAFCNIQISSVTTLMDPMSPEDPNQDKSLSLPEKDLEKQFNNDHSEEPGKEDDSAVGAIKIVNSESLAEKDAGKEDSGEGDSVGPKIRLSSAVSVS